jgi:hypothetical protein
VEVSAIVVLLDQDTVSVVMLTFVIINWDDGKNALEGNSILGNGLESDARVSDRLNGAGIASRGLHSDTIHGVLDHVVGEGHSVDNIVSSAAHGAYRKTVSTGASTA